MSSRLTIAMAAFALVSVPVQGQQAGSTLLGQVVSSDGIPVVGAEISLDGSPARMTSDSSGRFAIPVAKERTRVRVRALGYTPLDTVLTFESAQSTTLVHTFESLAALAAH